MHLNKDMHNDEEIRTHAPENTRKQKRQEPSQQEHQEGVCQ